MGSSKFEKKKKWLVESGLMEENDTVVDLISLSYVKNMAFKMGAWTNGWGYFTETRLIVPTGILDENIIIPYHNIQDIKKCSQFFLPIGIIVSYKDIESGKLINQKISMMKRDKWIAFMNERRN